MLYQVSTIQLVPHQPPQPQMTHPLMRLFPSFSITYHSIILKIPTILGAKTCTCRDASQPVQHTCVHDHNKAISAFEHGKFFN